MFDHYIAVDWAQMNMAIARMTASSEKVHVVDVPTDLEELKIYLGRLKGKKILTIEESHVAQWLYTELKSLVDEILVCDPYRNHLLKEGAKNDKIDATKLVKLLRAKLLKPVFHSGDEFIHLRKLTSGYNDLIQSGVRLKNQRSALFRSNGATEKKRCSLRPAERFVLQGLEQAIEIYEDERERYQDEFADLCKKNKILKNLKSVPGIAEISAVQIAAIVVDPRRFKSKGAFLAYCGLVDLERISGGRSYGKKKPRCNRELKKVFKVATFVLVTNSKSTFKTHYDQLISEKGYAPYNARHAVCRRLAILCYGVMKSGKKFKPATSWKDENLCNES